MPRIKLKLLSKDAIPSAFERAERYRLMNEPISAESVCLDILEVDPANQQALKILILSLSEQFSRQLNPAFTKSKEIVQNLSDEYSKAFYSGIIFERRAKSHLNSGAPGSKRVAYDWIHRAMESYEKAMELQPPKNADATLRWNTCARIVLRNPEMWPKKETSIEEMLE